MQAIWCVVEPQWNTHRHCIDSGKRFHGTSTVQSRPCGAGTMLHGELLSEHEALNLCSAAAEHGIVQWDTAEMYPVPQRAATQGASESLLGKWLQGRKRDVQSVTTKVAGPGGMEWLRGGPEQLDGENICAAVEGSLRRLRTDYVDTLLLHWPDRCAHCARHATRTCGCWNERIHHVRMTC